MEIKLDKMCGWVKRKALYLSNVALDLEMDLDGHGELNENLTSGYTYLWLEDYSFTLYMPINCELAKEDVWVMWDNPENGEEIEMILRDQSLSDLEAWASRLNRKLGA